ncbi:MAG: hypothetical protein QNJ38_01745 [Prochloraceae cyanobacterium]|nr:hypothetical protein [Prochloraceae cyanobacterium]
MNNPENKSTERRLEELELELEKNEGATKKDLNPQQSSSSSLENFFKTVLGWFESLPSSGKIAVAVVGVIVGFSVLSSFLKLVASLLTIAILSLILYGVYKFVVK